MNKKDLLIIKGKELAFLLRHDNKAYENGQKKDPCCKDEKYY